MTFNDLPKDWSSRPINDPQLVSDVLDLLVSTQDRRSGGLLLAICDAEGRLLQPTIMNGPEDCTDPEERRTTLSRFLDLVASVDPNASLLAAIARSHGLSVTQDDRDWGDAIAEACHGRVRLLGVHLITLAGSRPLPAGSPPETTRPAASR